MRAANGGPSIAPLLDNDRVKVARLLRRAHTVATQTGVVPGIVRKVISDSWLRSVAAGVDPGSPAPQLLDPSSARRRLVEHPIADTLGIVTELLSSEFVGSRYFAAVSDAAGVLLWTEGPMQALKTAVAPRFMPGYICSEERIGTNAIGTALVLDQAVQVFSAEHFSELLHGWVCAAAPVHDPETGNTIGAIDLSGPFRTSQAHSLALVVAVARAIEGRIATARHVAERRLIDNYHRHYPTRCRTHSALVTATGRVLVADPPGWLEPRISRSTADGEWIQHDGGPLHGEPFEDGFVMRRVGRSGPRPGRSTVSFEALGRERVAIVRTARSERTVLRPRHSDLVVLLALHPQGMTVRDLSEQLYGSEDHGAAIRAEMTRLRSLLGDLLVSRPYRLAEGVRFNVTDLLAGSKAPGIVRARHDAAFLQP